MLANAIFPPTAQQAELILQALAPQLRRKGRPPPLDITKAIAHSRLEDLPEIDCRNAIVAIQTPSPYAAISENPFTDDAFPAQSPEVVWVDVSLQSSPTAEIDAVASILAVPPPLPPRIRKSSSTGFLLPESNRDFSNQRRLKNLRQKLRPLDTKAQPYTYSVAALFTPPPISMLIGRRELFQTRIQVALTRNLLGCNDTKSGRYLRRCTYNEDWGADMWTKLKKKQKKKEQRSSYMTEEADKNNGWQGLPSPISSLVVPESVFSRSGRPRF